MLFADGSSTACSAWRSVKTSPAATSTRDSPRASSAGYAAACAALTVSFGPCSPGPSGCSVRIT